MDVPSQSKATGSPHMTLQHPTTTTGMHAPLQLPPQSLQVLPLQQLRPQVATSSHHILLLDHLNPNQKPLCTPTWFPEHQTKLASYPGPINMTWMRPVAQDTMGKDMEFPLEAMVPTEPQAMEEMTTHIRDPMASHLEVLEALVILMEETGQMKSHLQMVQRRGAGSRLSLTRQPSLLSLPINILTCGMRSL